MVGTRRRSLILTLLVLVSLLGAPLLGAAPAVAQADDVPLDLAAMALTPLDLDAVGLEGFGRDVGYPGQDQSISVTASRIANNRDIETDEVVGVMEEAGWLRQYSLPLTLLEDQNDLMSAEQGVISTITQYTTADGAEAAFAYLEDESQFEDAELYEDIDAVEVGDESELTVEYSQPQFGDPVVARARLTFRTDALIGEVLFADLGSNFVLDTSPGSEAVTAVEDAAVRMLERIEDVSAQTEPGLSVLVLRLEVTDDNDGNGGVEAGSSNYYVLEGRTVQSNYQTQDAANEANKANQASGLVAGYFQRHSLDLPGDTNGATIDSAIERYEDDEAAQTALENTLENVSEVYEGVEELTDVKLYGDDSVAMSYPLENTDGETRTAVRIHARIGNDIIRIVVHPYALEPSPMAAEILMDEQIRCFEAGSCLDPVPAPAELLGDASTGEETSEVKDEEETPEDEETPEATEAARDHTGDAEVYESPTYGYTLAYDPNEWEILLEDEDPDDPYDVIYLFNGVSVVGLIGDPDYAETDLDSCIDDYGQSLEQEEGVTDVDPLRGRGNAGSEEGVAWATYAYVYTNEDGAESEDIRYYECRAIGDGVTLVILHDAPADVFDDEVEAREELLEGLEAGA